MKTTLRLAPLAAVAIAASLLSGCQGTSLATASGSLSFSSVPAVLQANPDLLGGLVGREAVGTLAVRARLASVAKQASAPTLAFVQ